MGGSCGNTDNMTNEENEENLNYNNYDKTNKSYIKKNEIAKKSINPKESEKFKDMEEYGNKIYKFRYRYLFRRKHKEDEGI